MGVVIHLCWSCLGSESSLSCVTAVTWKPAVIVGATALHVHFARGLYLSESSFSCVAAVTWKPAVIVGATDLHVHFARGGRAELDGIAGESDAGKSESFV